MVFIHSLSFFILTVMKETFYWFNFHTCYVSISLLYYYILNIGVRNLLSSWVCLSTYVLMYVVFDSRQTCNLL